MSTPDVRKRATRLSVQATVAAGVGIAAVFAAGFCVVPAVKYAAVALQILALFVVPLSLFRKWAIRRTEADDYGGGD